MGFFQQKIPSHFSCLAVEAISIAERATSQEEKRAFYKNLCDLVKKLTCRINRPGNGEESKEGFSVLDSGNHGFESLKIFRKIIRVDIVQCPAFSVSEDNLVVSFKSQAPRLFPDLYAQIGRA